jgi:hypothetical protein
MAVLAPRAAFAGVILLGPFATSAWAQSHASCSDAHKMLLEKLEQQSSASLPPEQLAAQRRKAKRAYDACLTGDVHDPKALFERLDVRKY